MAAHISEFLPGEIFEGGERVQSDALYQYDDHYEVARCEIGLIDDDLGAANDDITLPYLYQARHYQVPVWDAMFPSDPLADAVKRAVLVWHRRAGKDKTCVNLLATKMVERVGYYLYLLPKQTQARKVIWKGQGKEQKDPDTGEIIPGVKFLDHFPPELVRNVNNTEMTIEFINGSICQLGGADSFDAMMGTNPIGIIFSEYSLQNPLAWDYFRPILAENDGWAIFEYTPRGRNHGYFMKQQAVELARKEGSGWFFQQLTVNDTHAIPLEAIEAERAAGMSEEMVQQEFFCSFDAYNRGSIYGKQIKLAWKEKRIKLVPVDTRYPVSTFWDIGISKGAENRNAIWLAQLVDGEAHVVGYYENDDEGLDHYLMWLQDWKTDHNISWGLHWAPHDIQVRDWVSKKSRRAAAAKKGIKFKKVPNIPRADGIDAARKFLATCKIDEEACKKGIAGLTDYSYKFDEELQQFSRDPIHNWASNPADAFRMMAVAWKDEKMQINSDKPQRPPGKPVSMSQEWSPFE